MARPAIRPDYHALCSPYLSGGIAQDRFDFQITSATARRLTAEVTMIDWFRSPTDPNDFHLSAPMAVQIASQLGIVLGHVALGLTKKESEVWMKDYEMRFVLPIRNPERIPVTLEIVEERESQSKPGAFTFTMTIALADSFFGRVTLFFQR